jgi:hypothetical protein
MKGISLLALAVILLFAACDDEEETVDANTGTWIVNNQTAYRVELKNPDDDRSYAVIPPNKEVSIPVELGKSYGYSVVFTKELKFGGKVVAELAVTDPSRNNTIMVEDASKPFTTTILPADVPGNTSKPAVLVKNNSAKSVKVYYSTTQKTNGAAGVDFVITGGTSAMISGFEINDDTANINFSALTWTTGNKYVPVSMAMQADKVYEIVIPQDEDAANISVTEVDLSAYYQ